MGTTISLLLLAVGLIVAAPALAQTDSVRIVPLAPQIRTKYLGTPFLFPYPSSENTDPILSACIPPVQKMDVESYLNNVGRGFDPPTGRSQRDDYGAIWSFDYKNPNEKIYLQPYSLENIYRLSRSGYATILAGSEKAGFFVISSSPVTGIGYNSILIVTRQPDGDWRNVYASPRIQFVDARVVPVPFAERSFEVVLSWERPPWNGMRRRRDLWEVQITLSSR